MAGPGAKPARKHRTRDERGESQVRFVQVESGRRDAPAAPSRQASRPDSLRLRGATPIGYPVTTAGVEDVRHHRRACRRKLAAASSPCRIRRRPENAHRGKRAEPARSGRSPRWVRAIGSTSGDDLTRDRAGGIRDAQYARASRNSDWPCIRALPGQIRVEPVRDRETRDRTTRDPHPRRRARRNR